MNVHLLHPDRDFDSAQPLTDHAEAVAQDLDLGTLLHAMSRGDRAIADVAARALLGARPGPRAAAHRQRVLADFLDHPSLARSIYDITVEATTEARRVYYSWSKDSPDAILGNAVRILEFYLPALRRLRRVADEHRAVVASEGLRLLFATLSEELDDDYLHVVEDHLARLRFRGGTLVSAQLGVGNDGTNYIARVPRRRSWRASILGWRRPRHGFDLHPRDDNGFRALARIRGMAINNAANALARAAEHVRGFVAALQTEVAFYVGCVNLHERLTGLGAPTCFPEVAPAGEGPALTAFGLVDPCLTLHVGGGVVGNEFDADRAVLLVVTGANKGGKTTFLRSFGIAQLMMEAGMFVTADRFRSTSSGRLFTHFRREEDPTMRRGKLEEELARMSDITDAISGGDILLCNESLSSTNEREASRIARGIVGAMTEQGIRVVYVTHLYDLARSLADLDGAHTEFLRAERLSDGRRTFRMVPGEPLPTSHGEDLYHRIFGSAAGAPREGSGGAA